jgi:hypothetical protein
MEYTRAKHTEQDCVKEKFVTPSIVQLKDRHVPCCAYYEKSQEDSSDWNVDTLFNCPTECPYCWKVWGPMINLEVVSRGNFFIDGLSHTN